MKNHNKMNKIAYPQGYDDTTITRYDINKWVNTLNSIYLYTNNGYDFKDILKEFTKNWEPMEKSDFEHWMKFYQGNNQNSYKTAQYLQVAPGAMIPNKPKELDSLKPNISFPEMEDPKFLINKKIRAIISRLAAAEKLATDPDVQRELSKRLDVSLHKWLEELQRVKRLVQVAPLKHINSSLLEDLIIKEANILFNNGFPKTAKELIKVAQVMPINPGNQTPAIPPPPGIPQVPTEAGGLSPQPESSIESEEDIMQQFVKNLNLNSDSDSDSDSNEIVDMEDDPLASITVMAQEVPQMSSVPQGEAGIENPAIEVEEALQSSAPADTILHNKTDNLFEQALSSVTIQDIIERLDALVNLFRTRELPRQLAIIDLMMDQLNLSSFFPAIAEASSKTLESNQYALVRIEEVLSKLKGSIKNPKDKEIDLVGKEPSKNPNSVNLDGVRNALEADEQAEKARKEQRKQEEQNKAKLTPTVEVTEDLSQPAQVVSPAAQVQQAPATQPTK